MGTAYTKTSPTNFVDGETINASDFTTEFDAIDATFETGGHQHDGTDGEGGAIEKLLSNTITFGTGVDTDIAVTFNANTADGVLTWMEDEDYFKFSDDVLINSNEKLYFRDTAIYLNSSADGQLDIVADTEIQIAATTIDINGNVDISGTVTIGSAEISEAELEILDGATATTAELNIVDGDTSATSTTVADADRVVLNDNGTMVQVAVTDLAAYFDDEITAMPNLVTTAATTVGALDSGSITSGFGNIDTGSSTITTTGLISGGSLDIDDVLINGTTIGHTDDTDLITLADGVVTVAGELDATTLDISGNADIDGTTNLDAVDIDGAVQIDATVTVGANDQGYDIIFYGDTASANMTWDTSADDLIFNGGAGLIVPDGQFTLGSTAVTTTAAEINLIDGGTSRGTTAVASGDGILINDAGTMRMTNVDTVSTYFSSHNVGGSNIVTTGALNSGSITSGFGTIDTGSSAITTTGLISGGSLDIDDVLINGTTIGHTDDTDLITLADGVVTVAGELDAATLDISGNADIDGTLEADAMTLNGTAITDTATLSTGISNNNVPKFTSGVADNDFLRVDGTAIEGRSASEVLSDIAAAPAAGSSNVVTTGALNSGSITSGFGNIDTGSSTITTTGLISGGSLDIDDVLINGTTIGHTDDTDLITLANAKVTVAGELETTTLDVNGHTTVDVAGEAMYVTTSGSGTNALRVIGSDASYTGNVLQPWTVRAAGTAFDLIECVTNNGSEVPFRVRGDGQLTTSGNIGIGVTPTIDSALAGLSIGGKILHVHDTSGASLKLSDAASSANRGLGLANVGVEAALVNCEAGDMRFGTGNQEKMRIDHSVSGLVIGTTTADCLLHVHSTAATSAKVKTTATDSYAELIFQDGNAGYAWQTRSDNAQSTGTGSFLLNDRDTSTFPVVIKEGNATDTLVLSGSKVYGTSQILQFPPHTPIANSTGSEVSYYQNGALTSTDASLHNTPLPHALTVNEMRVYVNSALTGGGARVYVVKNASDITGTNKEIDVTTGSSAFHASAVATDFAAGDRIGIKIILEDGASAAWYHVTLLCTLTE